MTDIDTRRAEGAPIAADPEPASVDLGASVRADQLAALKDTRARETASRAQEGYGARNACTARLHQLQADGWHVVRDRRAVSRTPVPQGAVVVGPAGIVALDVRDWAGDELCLDAQGLRVGRTRHDDALVVLTADKALIKQLADTIVPGVQVAAVLALVNDVGVPGATWHQGAFVLQDDQLDAWLVGLPDLLSEQEVAALVRLLENTLPARIYAQSHPAVPRVTRVPAPVAAPVRPRRRDRRRRTVPEKVRLRQELRGIAVRVGVVAALVLVVPQTTGWVGDHVLRPLQHTLGDSLLGDR